MSKISAALEELSAELWHAGYQCQMVSERTETQRASICLLDGNGFEIEIINSKNMHIAEWDEEREVYKWLGSFKSIGQVIKNLDSYTKPE
jgi:hypothetical protein